MVRIRKKPAAIIKTTTKVGKKTAAIVKTIATMETVAVIGITAAIAKTFKVFRKKVIITTEKKTAIMVARFFKRGSTISFNGEKKYI